MEKNVKLSLIILTRAGREEMLEKCLRSLEDSLKRVSPREKIELILAGSCIGAHIRRNITSACFRVILHESEKAGKSGLRNGALSRASGEIVYFLDDDVFVKSDFISRVIEKFDRYKQAAVIGGPNLTPPGSGVFEKAQGSILSSWWGAAHMSRRYRPAREDVYADQRSFTLCNLGFRRSMLSGLDSFFDERLNYNEENDLLARLKTRGQEMVFTDINVFHYRRKTLKGFLGQVFESGQGRARSIKINSINSGFIYFLPALFVLYIPAAALMLAAGSARLFVPLAFYAALCAAAALWSFVTAGERKLRIIPAVFFLVFLSHISYGAGMIRGFSTGVRR